MTKTHFQPQEGYVIPANGIEVTDEGAERIIKYDIAQTETEEGQPAQYVANEIRISRGAEYCDIVSAIINDRYSNDEMQAIINNHLFDENCEHQNEFDDMQAWRKHAKSVAKYVIG